MQGSYTVHGIFTVKFGYSVYHLSCLQQNFGYTVSSVYVPFNFGYIGEFFCILGTFFGYIGMPLPPPRPPEIWNILNVLNLNCYHARRIAYDYYMVNFLKMKLVLHFDAQLNTTLVRVCMFFRLPSNGWLCWQSSRARRLQKHLLSAVWWRLSL